MPYNYIQQPRTQGQGFYNPYMPGPDIGQGVPQLMQQLMQIQMYQQERKKEMEKFWLEYEQQQKRDKAYIEHQEALTDKARQPVVKAPTARDERKTIAAEKLKSREWDTNEAITFIEKGEIPKPIPGIHPQGFEKYMVNNYGKNWKNDKRVGYDAYKDEWDEWQLRTRPDKTQKEPPISQPSLVTKVRQQVKRVMRHEAQRAGVDAFALTEDMSTSAFVQLIMQKTSGQLSPAAQIAQQIDNALGEYEVKLSDRKLSPQEKQTIQKYMMFLSDVERVLQDDPKATYEKLMFVLNKYMNQ